MVKHGLSVNHCVVTNLTLVQLICVMEFAQMGFKGLGIWKLHAADTTLDQALTGMQLYMVGQVTLVDK